MNRIAESKHLNITHLRGNLRSLDRDRDDSETAASAILSQLLSCDDEASRMTLHHFGEALCEGMSRRISLIPFMFSDFRVFRSGLNCFVQGSCCVMRIAGNERS